MKRRLVLHLGIPKTGTTSIQALLRQNPDVLSSLGALYPKLGVDPSDHVAFKRHAFNAHLGLENNHVALALEIQKSSQPGEAPAQTPLWRAAFRLIDQSEARTAIISFEKFAMSVETYAFDLLAPSLRDYDVRGLVYLRSQEDWVISLYGEAVRGRGRLAVALADYGVFRGRRGLAYSRRLDAIRSAISLDDLVVGNFDLAARTGLLADFMQKSGLPHDPRLEAQATVRKNPSLPHWATLFLMRCNQEGVPDKAFLDLRAAIRKFAVAGGAVSGLDPGIDAATPEERAALRAVTAGDAERLMERYGVALSATGRDPLPYRPFEEDDFQAIKATLAPEVASATRNALDRI